MSDLVERCSQSSAVAGLRKVNRDIRPRFVPKYFAFSVQVVFLALTIARLRACQRDR